MSTGSKRPATIKAEELPDKKGWSARVHQTPDNSPDGPVVFSTDRAFADEKSATQEAQNWADSNGYEVEAPPA